MSKPISDAQLYGLLWAASCRYGAFSELHDVPLTVTAPGGQRIRLFRTALDRPQLLGLGRRGMLREHNGLWEITDVGRAEIERCAARIAAMVDATREDDRQTQIKHDQERESYVGYEADAKCAECDPDPDPTTLLEILAPTPRPESRRGGARPGAGRKPLRGARQSERINLPMTEAERAEIEVAVPADDTPGRWIVEAALMRARTTVA